MPGRVILLLKCRVVRLPVVAAPLSAVALCACVAAPPGPFPGVTSKSVVYSVRDGPRVLTAWFPERSSEPGDLARPIVLLFHGGGFVSGAPEEMTGTAQFLARQGFVAVTVQYSLAPRHPFPAAVQDAFAAVRCLRKLAGEFGGDGNRIGVLGVSAGANLAMMVAYCDDPESQFPEPSGADERFPPCGDPAVSPRVQAVVNVYGPCDLTYNFEKAPWWARSMVERYLGAPRAQDAARWRRASPLFHVKPGAPPTLTVHGLRDSVVGFEQAERLDRRLRELHVPHVLVPVDAEHGWAYQSGTTEWLELLPSVTAFLVRALECESTGAPMPVR